MRIIMLLMLVALLAALPVSADVGSAWSAQFFNNAILQGPAALTRTDTAVAFNWGGGSPGAGVNADNFSARWGTDVFLPAGTYRFSALADDSVRINVDYQFTPVVDTFSQPQQVGQTVTGLVTLYGGTHHIQVDYVELGGSAFVYVSWENVNTVPSAPTLAPTPVPPTTSSSWTAQYFANRDLGGFPTLIQSEATPTHNWGSGSPVVSLPVDNFSARWTSTQNLAAGTYRISVRSDDGVRVFVDGVAVIDQWRLATGQSYTGDITLSAGLHNFMVEYFEAGGEAFLEYTFTPLGASIPPTPVVPPAGGVWQCAYYNNINIIGFPVATLVEASPSHNWGTGAPIAGLPADNFSMRCTSTQSLEGGVYRVTASADDGVQIKIDGSPVISEWHSASGTPYSASVNLTAGAHSVEVEFYEGNGAAFLTYSLERTGGASAPAATNATLTVRASRLNVRAEPNANTGAIIGRISRGERYPIVGRTQDSRWWQININGTYGWVFGSLTDTSNTGSVPVTNASDGSVQATGITATAETVLNIRSLPSSRAALYGTFPLGATAELVGRNSDGSWLQIRYNNTVGWVSRLFVTLSLGADLSRVPVTG
jgi:uncharacterized protein YraI